MKKQKAATLFLNKVKISKINNASALFGGTAAAQPHEAHDASHQNDSHSDTDNTTSDSNTNTSVSPYFTCSLGAGEVTNG